MTTTLWIVIMIAVLCIGLIAGLILSFWINDFDLSGLKATCDSIHGQLLNKIISDTGELDALRCINKGCGRRTTPDEKTMSHLYSVGYGAYMRRNQSLTPNCRPEDTVDEVEQANIEAAESAKVNDAPGCEGDDCKLTFCGGDGIE